MKFCSLLILIPTVNFFPQDIYSEQPAATINLMPVYENWTVNDSSDFSEFTNVMAVGYNPFDNTSFGLVTRYASVNTNFGSIGNSLSGLSDLQLIVKQKLPNQNLTFDGGLNIPTGKTKLKPDEFAVSQVISQELFGLRTSNFGTGLNGFLGVTWLQPVSDAVVIGAGVSYQLKSEYQPVSDNADKYKPSNEISVTGGLDIKLGETQTVSGDFTGIFYGSDKLNGKEIFKSGSRMIFNAMYRQFFSFDYLALYVLYRNVAHDEVKGDYVFIENKKFTPNEIYLGASYNQRFSGSFSLGYGIFAGIYEKTANYLSGYTMYGASLSPLFTLSPVVSIPLYLKYAMGNAEGKSDLRNYELSAGIKFNL